MADLVCAIAFFPIMLPNELGWSLGFVHQIEGLQMKKWGLLIALLLNTACLAEVISVPQSKTGFFITSDPTQTLYWQGVSAKALIVFIPGGDGNLGLKPTDTDRKYSFFQTLKSLTNPALTSGQYDVVLIDFPVPLAPPARGTEDHITRIQSVIDFYHDKTGLPIWLMGHSNGGLSLTHFIQFLQKNQKSDAIAGVVASGIRSESYFKAPIDFPMLFIHHASDACSATPGSQSYATYERVKEFTKGAIQYTLIKGGEAEARDPCRSGYHMYFNAGTEPSLVIDEFIKKSLK